MRVGQSAEALSKARKLKVFIDTPRGVPHLISEARQDLRTVIEFIENIEFRA